MSREQAIYRATLILTRLLRPAWQAGGLHWGESEEEDVEILLNLLFSTPSSSFAPSKPTKPTTEEEDGDALEAALDKLLSDDDSDSDDDDGALPSPNDLDLSDDGDALASAGFGTDEDYGGGGDYGDF